MIAVCVAPIAALFVVTLADPAKLSGPVSPAVRLWNAAVTRVWYALDCPPRLPFGIRQLNREEA